MNTHTDRTRTEIAALFGLPTQAGDARLGPTALPGEEATQAGTVTPATA